MAITKVLFSKLHQQTTTPAMLHQNFFTTLVIGNLSYTRVTSLPNSISTCFYSQEKIKVKKSKSQRMFPMHNFVLIHENSKSFDIQQGYHQLFAALLPSTGKCSRSAFECFALPSQWMLTSISNTAWHSTFILSLNSLMQLKSCGSVSVLLSTSSSPIHGN